jgi:metallo-beta-lactamase class B
MHKIFFIFLLTFVAAHSNAQRIFINNDLQLIRLSPSAYIHVSYMNTERVPCNGMLLVDGNKAFLFDTPASDSITRILLDYIKNVMKLEVAGFVSNDWHKDSMGGLAVLKEKGIPSYAHEMTRDSARQKGLPVHDQGFRDSLALKLGNKDILCYYLGPAHTMDNIVVWFPSERILFANCMVKELKAADLGYTADGDIKAYPYTLRKVLAKFSQAKIVVPGHGAHGSLKLVKHTLALAEKR